MRTTIDDEDLALIQEAQQDKEEIPGQGSRASGTPASAAKTEAELSRGLFSNDSGGMKKTKSSVLQKDNERKAKEN
jgi:hypothetical protein